jgi:hypothetical protein
MEQTHEYAVRMHTFPLSFRGAVRSTGALWPFFLVLFPPPDADADVADSRKPPGPIKNSLAPYCLAIFFIIVFVSESVLFFSLMILQK